MVYGSLAKPGAWADVVAVRGHPVKDVGELASIGAVIKGGLLVDDRMPSHEAIVAGGARATTLG